MHHSTAAGAARLWGMPGSRLQWREGGAAGGRRQRRRRQAGVLPCGLPGAAHDLPDRLQRCCGPIDRKAGSWAKTPHAGRQLG
jgi:hypothetical protein